MTRQERADTFARLLRKVRASKWWIAPILTAVVTGSIWVHDTDASVKRLTKKREYTDSLLIQLDKKVEVLDSKLDILLQERGYHAPARLP